VDGDGSYILVWLVDRAESYILGMQVEWNCILEEVFGEVARANGRKIKILFGYFKSRYNLSSM
jgi:hypothetical protein